MHYSTIFDVIAQHHPEYVALAWGAMKFLFVAVLNHENAITCLAKGMTRIADVLPRMELATQLYPTRRIMDAAEELYAYIIQFFIRAHDWYREGTFRHILHSITRPAELRYDDLLENIAGCSRYISELTVSASQVELRNVHKTLQKVTSQLDHSESLMQEMKALVINYQAINSSSLLDTNQKVTDLQFSEMIEIVSKVPIPDPTESYHHAVFMRRRRQLRNKIDIPTGFWHSSTLQKFSNSQTSSLILVKGSFRSRFSLRDAAVIITEELHRQSIPILWAVQTGTQDSSISRGTVKDVLKSLVAQALRLSTNPRYEKSLALSCTRLRTATDEAEWFQVLGSAVESLRQQVFIMLDMELLIRPSDDEEPADLQMLQLFLDMFRHLSQRGLGHAVKVMVFSYRPSSTFSITSESFSSIILPMASSLNQKRRMRRKEFRTIGSSSKLW
ncbi:hypothetical protein CC78DRAFT_456466 [Lojkania enalia]|uniref:DUF7708 domain-containing protein n=1 Tax=Lojkania enalia TaxID=147567 RepID=A0A9P4N6N9_9PLEO|nr:hypothetical protein CC78DRAFT_456466 [Didymosphaeria enalia]